MCLVKTPKLSTDPNAPPKEPTIIRNPYLDGVGPTARANRRGRSSLRIARGTRQPANGISPSAPPLAVVRPVTPPTVVSPTGPSPVQGGSGSGGSGRAPSRVSTYAY